MSRNFQEYIETQKKIYAAIRAETPKVYESGIRFDPRVSSGYRGLVIVLKYPESFAQKIVDLSLAIKKHTGVLMRARDRNALSTHILKMRKNCKMKDAFCFAW